MTLGKQNLRLPDQGTWTLTGDLNIAGDNLLISEAMSLGSTVTPSAHHIIRVAQSAGATITSGNSANWFLDLQPTMRIDPPATVSALPHATIGGYTFLQGTDWPAESQVWGLSFGPSCGVNKVAGNTSLGVGGVTSVGFFASGWVFGDFTCKWVKGLAARSVKNVLAGTLTVDKYVASLFLEKAQYGTIPVEHMLYVEKPTQGTVKYQISLAGNGTDTGIRFNAPGPATTMGNTTSHIYASADSKLVTKAGASVLQEFDVSSANAPKVSIGDITGGNTSEIEYDGTLKFNGNATVWEDLRVGMGSFTRRGSADPNWVQFQDNGAASTGIYLFAFDASTEQEVYFVIQMPHSWKEGTSIIPHVHWCPDGNGGAGEKVSWGLEYAWKNINDVFGNTSIVYGDTATLDEDLLDNKHYMTNLTAISGSGQTISSCLVCRLFRDAGGNGGTDDYGNDAFLLDFDIHYEIDTVGSRKIDSK